MNHTIYKIYTGGDAKRMEWTLTILFKYGYVFDRHFRYKTFEGVKGYWGTSISHWKWLIIGEDHECKMVINACGENYRDYVGVTLEHYLRLIGK